MCLYKKYIQGLGGEEKFSVTLIFFKSFIERKYKIRKKRENFKEKKSLVEKKVAFQLLLFHKSSQEIASPNIISNRLVHS